MSFGQKVYRTLKGGFTAVGVVTVSGACLGYLFSQRSKDVLDVVPGIKKNKLPKEFILELDLDRFKIVEASPKGPLDMLQSGAIKSINVREAVDGIQAAGNDVRVKGFLATGSGGLMGMAQVQEIRDAVSEFNRRKEGKAQSVYFAEEWDKMLPCYFASAFNKVGMQPSGISCFTGFAVTVPFMRSLLDKYNIHPWFLTREEYKNAAAMFTESTFSQHHQQSLEELLKSFSSQVIGGVAELRKVSESAVRSVMDASPMSAMQVLEGKLIDKTMYRDEVYDELQGGNLPRVSLKEYKKSIDKEAKKSKKKEKSKSKVAIVTGVGAIVTGWGSGNSQSPSIAAGKIVKDLQEIRRTPEIKAVVLRLDTPGGSAVASDAIRREIVKVRESGRPVIVSMGNVAASGGYYIATGADKIIAHPGTLTGSIGVIVGKFNLKGLLDDNGVNAETISIGKNAQILLPFNGVDSDQEAIANKLIDGIYEDFVGKVCEARKMDKERGFEVAKGRVWSGLEGLELGLVDKLGGMSVAVEEAIGSAGLSPDVVSVVDFPPPKKPIAQLMEALSDSDGYGPGGVPAAIVSMLLGATPWGMLRGSASQSTVGLPGSEALGGLNPLTGGSGFLMWSLDAICAHEGINK
ncbi:hypothetical protein BSKO_07044 [Bryopsis sp. KO-2023]|nr:hypothetical protein BSKO_07044 [Bryopsis sp. KO-2023]